MQELIVLSLAHRAAAGLATVLSWTVLSLRRLTHVPASPALQPATTRWHGLLRLKP